MRIHTALVGSCYIRQVMSIYYVIFLFKEKEKIFLLLVIVYYMHETNPFLVPPPGLDVVA